jgi:hypothetical protein
VEPNYALSKLPRLCRDWGRFPAVVQDLGLKRLEFPESPNATSSRHVKVAKETINEPKV